MDRIIPHDSSSYKSTGKEKSNYWKVLNLKGKGRKWKYSLSLLCKWWVQHPTAHHVTFCKHSEMDFLLLKYWFLAFALRSSFTYFEILQPSELGELWLLKIVTESLSKSNIYSKDYVINCDINLQFPLQNKSSGHVSHGKFCDPLSIFVFGIKEPSKCFQDIDSYSSEKVFYS